MILELPDGFVVTCCACRRSVSLSARKFQASRRELLDGGWQERPRKGGPKKSAWACPSCAVPASPSMGRSVGASPGGTKPGHS